MRKIGNLVLNEYIKTLAKISTIILLICIVVLSIGYNAVLRIGNDSYEYWNDPELKKQQYEEQIRWAQQERYEGWENEVKLYTALLDNYSSITWKNDAIWAIYQNYVPELEKTSDPAEKEMIQAKIDRLERAVAQNDWRDYLNHQIESVTADQALTEAERENAVWPLQYCLDHDLEPTSYDEQGKFLWKYDYLLTVWNSKQMVASELQKPEGERNRKDLETAQDNVLIGEYRLENDIEVCVQASNDATSLSGAINYWSVFNSSTVLLQILSVLIIIVAGGMIASEFSGGTVKFLLINPIKRWKILVSKYIAVVSIAFVMLLLFYILNAILAMVFFGAGDLGAPYLHVVGDKVVKGSSYLHVAGRYLLGSVGTVVMATFAFALSSLVRNSALSIGLGIFLMLSGSGAVAILQEFNFDWARYIVFANTDLNTVQQGLSFFPEHTLAFAVINLCVYMAVFMLTAWDGFMRRDIR